MAISKDNQGGRGAQGGSREQHAEAGRQSPKNAPSNSAGSSSSSQGGSTEQKRQAGRKGGEASRGGR